MQFRTCGLFAAIDTQIPVGDLITADEHAGSTPSGQQVGPDQTGHSAGAACSPTRAALAALAVAVLTTAGCTGSRPVTASHGPVPGQANQEPVSAPVQIGDRWQCPLGVGVMVLAGQRTYEPANFPGLERGSSVRPRTCYQSVQAAQAAGYTLAPTPPGDVLVTGVYLVPTSPALRAQCAAAAQRLHSPVPCPGALPTTALPAGCVDTCQPGSLPVFTLEFSSYLSPIAGEDPHAYIIGTPDPFAYFSSSCAHDAPDPFAATRAGELVLTCPKGSALNSGHVMVWLLRTHLAAAVSIHDATNEHRNIAQAIADRLNWTGPSP